MERRRREPVTGSVCHAFMTIWSCCDRCWPGWVRFLPPRPSTMVTFSALALDLHATFASSLSQRNRFPPIAVPIFPVLILDPAQECTPYSHSPVASQAGNFSSNWVQSAILLPNDTVPRQNGTQSRAAFRPTSQLKTPSRPTSPTSPPLTTPWTRNCWWSFDKCTTPKLAGFPINVP